jgi:hypothetical protein
MLTPSEKIRRFRARKRMGKGVLPIEVAFGPLADVLIAAGYLEAWDEGDRDKLRAALERAIAVWVTYE